MRRLILEEPVSVAATWSRRVAAFALAAAAISILLARLHKVEPAAALAAFGASVTLAIAAAFLAATAAVAIWQHGLRGASQASFGFALALALIAGPAYYTALAIALPAINDVSTDLDDPPSFMISTKARAAREGRPPGPPSPETRATQRQAYPDIHPVFVNLESPDAYDLCQSVIKDLGWTVIDQIQPSLRSQGAAQIDATVSSLVFGFLDDVTIRIRPLSAETRIDLRSVSRVGRHDFGANASHIRAFAAAVEAETQK